jgi:hypothetical protein
MDAKRLRGILSVLNGYELTSCENHFVEAVRSRFETRGELTDQQEAILEGIFNEKVRWARRGLIAQRTSA